MSQQNQGTSSTSPVDLPMKRKRGRPRKDESLVQTEIAPLVPGSDTVMENKESGDVSNMTANNIVGQVVYGVIEGSFDAGYLLNVKVGDSDTYMRGVVFQPGKFTPITAANDVAPNAKMHKREDIPIPIPQTQLHDSATTLEKSENQPVDINSKELELSEKLQTADIPITCPTSQIQLHDFVPLSENNSIIHQVPELSERIHPSEFQSNPVVEGEIPILCLSPHTQRSDKQPVSLHNQVSEFSELVQPSELQYCTVIASENQIFPSDALRLPSNFAVHDSELPSGEKTLPHQTVEAGLESQALDVTVQPEHDKLCVQDDMVQQLDASTLIKEPHTDDRAVKESKPGAALFVDLFQSSETFIQEPQLQQQAMSSDIPSNGLTIKNEAKTVNVEENQTPIFAEPEFKSSEPSEGLVFMEKQVPEKEDTPKDMQVELVNKDITESDPFNTNGSPLNAPPISCEGNAQSTPITNPPVTMFDGEAFVTEPEPAALENVVPRMVSPQVYSSSAPTDSVDCNVNSAIPPAQS